MAGNDGSVSTGRDLGRRASRGVACCWYTAGGHSLPRWCDACGSALTSPMPSSFGGQHGGGGVSRMAQHVAVCFKKRASHYAVIGGARGVPFVLLSKPIVEEA